MATERPKILHGVMVPYAATVGRLRAQLEPPGPNAWAACMALAHHPEREAFTLLLELLDYTDWRYRHAAVQALAFHELAPTAATWVRACLKDTSPYVVSAACDTCAALGLMEARSELRKLLQSPEPWVRESAARALGTLWHATDFQPLFVLAQLDPVASVQREAAAALRAHAGRENWQLLFRTWRSHPDQRRRVWACELAREYGDASVDAALSILLGDPDPTVRQTAAQTLGNLWRSAVPTPA